MSVTQASRVHSSPNNSQTSKSNTFGEWISDFNDKFDNVDDDVLERHVDSVVEAIFNRYNENRDGFVTLRDFQLITMNFPFLDNFSEIDTDRDDRISKAELKEFFLQSNCEALKMRFRHNFHATTYKKPTFCVHCTGLIYGLIKQGLHCKDCGIDSHHRCRELVVVDCSRLANDNGCVGNMSCFN